MGGGQVVGGGHQVEQHAAGVESGCIVTVAFSLTSVPFQAEVVTASAGGVECSDQTVIGGDVECQALARGAEVVAQLLELVDVTPLRAAARLVTTGSRPSSSATSPGDRTAAQASSVAGMSPSQRPWTTCTSVAGVAARC